MTCLLLVAAVAVLACVGAADGQVPSSVRGEDFLLGMCLTEVKKP